MESNSQLVSHAIQLRPKLLQKQGYDGRSYIRINTDLAPRIEEGVNFVDSTAVKTEAVH